MDREERERRLEEIARFAQSEGAWYYDPDSPVIWKRFIIGPVPIWRRMLWAIFPPSYTKVLRIQQRRSDRIWREATSHITGRDMGVIVLGMTAPLILSALGPFYYGYTHAPYRRVIVWALASIVPFLWFARASLKHALSTAPPSIIGRSLLLAAIVFIAAVAFLAGHSLVYLLAHSL
jgi:hypothetical protein